MSIRFRFSPEKALGAVQWMLSTADDLDLHKILKTCYFADKKHLNEHFQPIFGATYQAMAYGPVPLEVYELLKGESLRLNELKLNAVPWEIKGYKVTRGQDSGNLNDELALFSDTEVDALEYGLKLSLEMNFTQRTSATHGRDWQKANGGIMRYEDMLDETDKKTFVIKNLLETARFIKL